jgi:CxxC motif-containing protein (DUF1111 family)
MIFILWTVVLSTALLVAQVITEIPGGGKGLPEAPEGFDNQTNGLVSQERFDFLRSKFEARKTIDEGLGPVFNGTSCAECHGSPVAAGASQIDELRVGKLIGGRFVEHPGGSLIQERATYAEMQERLLDGYDVRSLRLTTSTLGSGFVEAIADATLMEIAANQPPAVRGELIFVPVLEAGGALRPGRFGWKNQHASLESFAADALFNEIGITNPFFLEENSSNGRSVADYDNVPDPEDDGSTIRDLAEFMRATKAPSRDKQIENSADGIAGALLFEKIGCITCHTVLIATAPPGTITNGGAFIVPPALGSKLIQPYGDFLLHDIGVGDGIVQNGAPGTGTKLRTAPLWGMRTRSRLMHDGQSLTITDAIRRHQGQAAVSTMLFQSLPRLEREQLLTFLGAL